MNLQEIFSEDFQEKYRKGILTVLDIVNLSDVELMALKQFEWKEQLKVDSRLILFCIDIDKLFMLYKYSQADFMIVTKLIMFIDQDWKFVNNNFYRTEFINAIKDAPLKDIKQTCFIYARKILLTAKNVDLWYEFPQEFIDANEDIFLNNINISNDFKTKYYKKELGLDDIMNHLDVFKNFPVDSFVVNNKNLRALVNYFGYGNLQKLINKYPDVFEHLSDVSKLDLFCSQLYYQYKDYEKSFIYTLKYYIRCFILHYQYGVIPNWLTSIDFKVIDKYHSWEEMKDYNDNVILIDDYQRMIIEVYNFENIIKFEEETKFFSYIADNTTFNNKFYTLMFLTVDKKYKLNPDNFKRTVTYEKFLIYIRYYFHELRKHSALSNHRYDFIKGSFRENNPHLFIDENVSEELKEAFYNFKIDLKMLSEHPEYIPLLKDKKIEDILSDNIKAKVFCDKFSSTEKEEITYNFLLKTTQMDLISFYEMKFGREKTLKLLSKYGDLFKLQIEINIKEHYSEEEIEAKIREAFYKQICKFEINYSILQNCPEFKKEYPNIFLDLSNVDSLTDEDKKQILDEFYDKNLKFETVKKYPILIKLLEDKRLDIAFSKRNSFRSIVGCIGNGTEIDRHISPQTFLKLCAIYGRYLNCINCEDLKEKLSGNYFYYLTEELSIYLLHTIEDFIKEECYKGFFEYSLSDAPKFLKEKYPELFLSEDAPKILKSYFYNINSSMRFCDLKANPDWLPYLENKSVITPLFRNYDSNGQISLQKYFDLFGDKAIKLGIQKPETVEKMIEANAVETMKKWYDATGGKFIPDYVVMLNFPIYEIDKFLSSISYWSRLMKIEKYASNEEGREVLLKLAYAFGIFENDAYGYQKLNEFLNGVPHIINEDEYCSIKNIDIDTYNTYDSYNRFTKLQEAIKEEKLDINNDMFLASRLYRKNGENSYVLVFNPQDYPKTTQALRICMEKIDDSFVISPTIAHQLFGGFKMIYDKDFRDFFLNNFDTLYSEYDKYISNIQRQFGEIKVVNSNRNLTLDLVIRYVQQYNYNNVDIGNEKMAEIVSIAGYSQEDFDALQKIYNYGKMRVFSSIPRIENKTDEYSYKILKLDDPLALVIGTLTNCCQTIDGAGESCMEHSMIDKNGRLFVIYDKEENIVSQSWVWRNKDVLCFDNIEVPYKAFKRTSLNKKDLAKEIYDIYEKASQELIEEDERVYKHLLEEGKITEDEYNGLRLGLVTVGLGYNDIAGAIQENAENLNEKRTKPLPFKSFLHNNNYLYTMDSANQYILTKRDDRIEYKGETLAVHSDIYNEYDNTNFTEKELITLIKMELVTKKYKKINLDRDDFDDSNNLILPLAETYDLNPETTRVIMNSNFAIVYAYNRDEIIIGEILFIKESQEILNNKNYKNILMQVYLALNNILDGRKVNIDNLNNIGKEIMENILEIASNDIDKEKGLKKIK